MGKDFYWLVNRTLCIHLQDAFFFYLSPHQFGMAIKDMCEVMVDVFKLLWMFVPLVGATSGCDEHI
jgi:hypothetical protein